MLRSCVKSAFLSPMLSPVSGGGGGFTPADITTLGWWDASDTSPTNIIQSGGLVSQITDIGTSGVEHLVQANSSNRMSTGLQTINSLNALSSLTDDKFMFNGTFPIPASRNVSASMVAQIDGQTTDTNASLVSMDASADWQLNSDNGSVFDGELTSSNIGDGSIVLTGGPYTGSLVIWTLEFDLDNLTKSIYANGTLVGTGTYTGGMDLSQSLRIFTNRAASQFTFGLFGEMVIFEDLSQRGNVETYLTNKWMP
ncbi:MAG: hypothetical protein BBJ57_02080 [Desulfobacterales bacterium PC51MH44]|nr:MAG: hypothetical protein BBJ57_02080 [Desulfobacterales bacterium PC51MH44]